MKLFSILASLLMSPLALEVAGSTSCQGQATPTRFRFERRSNLTSSVSNSTASLIAPSSSIAVNVSETSISASLLPSISSSGAVGSHNSSTSATPTSNNANSSSTSLEPTITLSGINATATSSINATATPLSPSTNPTTAGAAQIIVVLQLAFVLETLEFEFYKAGLSKFGIHDFAKVGYSTEQAAIIVEELQLVLANEQNHVAIIEETILALGAQPFKGCGFALDAALLHPITFISTARTFETVGIAAYAGAAHLVSDPQLLTAIATILPIESRHSSLLNTFSGGTLAPQSFEIALNVASVLALVGGFLKDCSPADLGLVANQPLGVVEAQFGSTFFTTGSHLVFAVSVDVDITALFCQMIIGGSPAALVLPAPACVIPQGIDGPVAVYLTNSSTPLASNILVQNVAEIIAGPGIIFVDSRTTILSSLFIPPLVDAPLYSVDMGGYWVEKRKGAESPKLVKPQGGQNPGDQGRVRRSRSRSRSVPDSLLENQGIYRRAEGWDSD